VQAVTRRGALVSLLAVHTWRRLLLLRPSCWGGVSMAPVHVSAATSNLGRLRAALDSGQPVDSLNPDRATPLMYGSFAGSMDIVTELIQRGADVRACDQVCHQNPSLSTPTTPTNDRQTRTHTRHSQTGFTPLHYCANKGSVDVARALIQAGADPCARDNVRMSPQQKPARCTLTDTVCARVCL